MLCGFLWGFVFLTSLSPAWAAECSPAVPVSLAALLLRARVKAIENATEELSELQEEKTYLPDRSAVTEMRNRRNLKAAIGKGHPPLCAACREACVLLTLCNTASAFSGAWCVNPIDSRGC